MNESVSLRKAYGQTLVELGKKNKDIVVLDADLSHSTKTFKFGEAFPDRFFNMGIAEQNMMGTAAGLAGSGKIPFVSSFAMFATMRCFEQIRNSVAYSNLNVNIVATHAGLTVGKDGSSHQPLEDIAIMRSLPNMRVMVPADANEVKAMVPAAAERPGPDYIRLTRINVPTIYDEKKYKFSEKADVLREGKDITIVACGIMVERALEAADKLKEEGIEATVINMHVIKPLDAETLIKWAKVTKGVVTAEEHTIIGGLGGAVAEVLSEKCPVPLRRVGVKDRFGESGTPDELLEKYGLTSFDIINAALEIDGR
jgi:transketolase